MIRRALPLPARASFRRRAPLRVVTLWCLLLTPGLPGLAEEAPEPHSLATAIDRAFGTAGDTSTRAPVTSPAPVTSRAPLAPDEVFLKRLSLDLTGRTPSADVLTAFVLDPDPAKRRQRIDELSVGAEFGTRWARYFADAILYRAQDRRAQALRPELEGWLAEQFEKDRSWHETVTALVTAGGDVGGRAALIVAQMAAPEELAAETARLFLGIQLQCAQCHDHPYDAWKREQFHELAAFFPRLQVRRKGDTRPPSFEIVSVDGRANGRRPDRARNMRGLLRRLDKDGDGELQLGEVPQRLLKRLPTGFESADTDSNGGLNARELQKLTRDVRDKRLEHHMPDLENPDSGGTLIHPRFFLSGASPGEGVADGTRRETLAAYLVSGDEPWFARAFVNRVWTEMLGWGFVEPVDDLGPGRQVRFPVVLDQLAEGFAASGYRLRWLVRTIAATRAYQAELSAPPSLLTTEQSAAPCAKRLSSHQLFDTLVAALALDVQSLRPQQLGRLRSEFAALFGYDPSTPRDEIQGSISQALFLMNSKLLHGRMRARGGGPLSVLLRRFRDDRVALDELYLQVLSRAPTLGEAEVFLSHLEEVGRDEAFEDLLWSLVNSSEFQLKG